MSYKHVFALLSLLPALALTQLAYAGSAPSHGTAGAAPSPSISAPSASPSVSASVSTKPSTSPSQSRTPRPTPSATPAPPPSPSARPTRSARPRHQPKPSATPSATHRARPRAAAATETPDAKQLGVRIGAAFALPSSDDTPAPPSYPLTLIATLGIIGVGAGGIRVLLQRHVHRNPVVAQKHRMSAHTVVLHRGG